MREYKIIRTAAEAIRDKMNRDKCTQKDLAAAMGISKPYLNDLLHGRRELSALMAVRIEAVCGGAAIWMMQAQVDRQIEEAREIYRREMEGSGETD